jgi:hypothetical protein
LDKELVQQEHLLHPTTLSDKTGLECEDRNSENGLPSNNSVFPEPNLPICIYEEKFTLWKFNDKSTRYRIGMRQFWTAGRELGQQLLRQR